MTTTVATRSLAECEGAIERGRVGIIEAATALREIRDNRLYKEAGYKSFDPYCQERLGFTRARADQIIAAGETAEKLPTNVGGFIPEAQARELAPLKDDPPAMAEVMAEASANGAKPTAKAVKAAVQKRVAPKLPSCGGCAKPVDPAKRGNIPECQGDDGSLNSPAWHGKCWDAHLAEAAKASDEADATANRERHAPPAAENIVDTESADPALAAFHEWAESAPGAAPVVADGELMAELEKAEEAEVLADANVGPPVAFADVVIRVVKGQERSLKPIGISPAATRDADTIANVIRVAVARELLAKPLKIATKGKS